ncbi:MAG: dihydrofolate reductase [Nanoarchaeota archaeon]|nr:dihydrofolate reductase [Nanoarchaeota archaeon]
MGNYDKIEYSIIAAVPDNWVIGNGLKIPWYISEDFKLFKKRTLNNVVIMGKTTWDSLPIKPLPDRINIVLNKEQFAVAGAYVCCSLDEAFEKAASFEGKEIFVIGGASIYKQTIAGATYLYISHVKGEFEGDVFFPEFNQNDYEILEEKDYEEFTFRKYKYKYA